MMKWLWLLLPISSLWLVFYIGSLLPAFNCVPTECINVSKWYFWPYFVTATAVTLLFFGVAINEIDKEYRKGR